MEYKVKGDPTGMKGRAHSQSEAPSDQTWIGSYVRSDLKIRWCDIILIPELKCYYFSQKNQMSAREQHFRSW